MVPSSDFTTVHAGSSNMWKQHETTNNNRGIRNSKTSLYWLANRRLHYDSERKRCVASLVRDPLIGQFTNTAGLKMLNCNGVHLEFKSAAVSPGSIVKTHLPYKITRIVTSATKGFDPLQFSFNMDLSPVKSEGAAVLDTAKDAFCSPLLNHERTFANHGNSGMVGGNTIWTQIVEIC